VRSSSIVQKPRGSSLAKSGFEQNPISQNSPIWGGKQYLLALNKHSCVRPCAVDEKVALKL
jgi:hypothetical protein